MQRVYVICFYNEEESMLCVCAISANQLNSGHVEIEEGIGTALVKWARLRRMNLGDMKQHTISFGDAYAGSNRADYTFNAPTGQMEDFIR